MFQQNHDCLLQTKVNSNNRKSKWSSLSFVKCLKFFRATNFTYQYLVTFSFSPKKHVLEIPITFFSYLHITSSHKCLLNKHYRYSNGISNVGNIINAFDCDVFLCVFVLHPLIRLVRHDPDLTEQFVFLYAHDENYISFDG